MNVKDIQNIYLKKTLEKIKLAERQKRLKKSQLKSVNKDHYGKRAKRLSL